MEVTTDASIIGYGGPNECPNLIILNQRFACMRRQRAIRVLFVVYSLSGKQRKEWLCSVGAIYVGVHHLMLRYLLESHGHDSRTRLLADISLRTFDNFFPKCVSYCVERDRQKFGVAYLVGSFFARYEARVGPGLVEQVLERVRFLSDHGKLSYHLVPEMSKNLRL